MQSREPTSNTLAIHIKGCLFAPVLVGLDVDHLSRVGVIEDDVDVDRGREKVRHLGRRTSETNSFSARAERYWSKYEVGF